MGTIRRANLLLFSLYVIGSGRAVAEEAKIEGEDFVPATISPLPLEKSARIIGGRNAEEGQFPYQVSLRQRNVHICGGAIISPNYVLTAAHCVTSNLKDGTAVTPAADLSIRAGTSFLYTGGVVAKVAQVATHPKYRNFVNDIALLKLSTPLSLNQRVRPIPLATASPTTGKEITTSGWGRLRNGGTSSPRLQYVSLNAISNGECRRLIGNVPSSILCLAHGSGLGACQGDSGGPATSNGQLVGITNFVVGNCGSSAPDGFADVTTFVPWIKQSLNA